MKKSNLPTGSMRKRWIEKLSDEDFNNLSETDKDNLKRFQRYSYQRERKIKKMNDLKVEIKNLKEQITLLDENEESNFIKVQHLHNILGCRIEITRQKKTPKSIEKNKYTYGGTLGNGDTVGSLPYLKSKNGVRKTYGGKELEDGYVYHGKVISVNLEKPKSCYFQEESRMFKTITELTGIDISNHKNPLDSVKKLILPSYKEFIIYLMRKMGSKKFEKHSILFVDFKDWYKKNKK